MPHDACLCTTRASSVLHTRCPRATHALNIRLHARRVGRSALRLKSPSEVFCARRKQIRYLRWNWQIIFLFSAVYSALNEGRTTYKAEKLTATFHDRKKYTVHFKNLKFYLRHGLKLKKVHRVIAFRQTYFLRSYIAWCTQKRIESASTFSKDLFKLLANRYVRDMVMQLEG